MLIKTFAHKYNPIATSGLMQMLHFDWKIDKLQSRERRSHLIERWISEEI